MSNDEEKPSHHVPAYLQTRGYTIIPVHPSAHEILNRTCYASLNDIPVSIDIVAIFRPSAQVPAVVREAPERKKQQGDISVIWLQEGIYSDEAKKSAEDAGVLFIESRCMYKDYKHIFAGQKP
jgi:hypothetical protein